MRALGKSFIGIWFILFLAMAWGHYAPTPISDFVADDWGYLGYSANTTPSAIFHDTIRDYYRPINILVNRVLFLCPGDRPAVWAAARVVLHGGILALYLALLWQLFRSRRSLWAGGLLYAFIPLLHEMFYWENMVAILYYPLAMLAAVLLWARWIDGRSGAWAFVLSLPCYATAVLTYENCVPLCLVFPLYSFLYAKKRHAVWSSLYVGIAILYAAYRFTHGFGLGHAAIHGGSYFGEGEGLGLVGLVQNARTLLSWWLGGLGARSFLGGFDAFATLLPKWQFAFTVVSLLLLAALAIAWRGTAEAEPISKKCDCVSDAKALPLRGLVFGAVWVLLSYGPHLLFPAASRHHMIPVFGMGIFFAALLSLRPLRASAWVWCGLGMLCLVANAGNALAWRDAGTFCRRLYQHLEMTQDEWRAKDLVLFDTLSLRERQTPGLLEPRSDSVDTWAVYHNAILLRGFVGNGMLKMCTPNPPQGIQDTEHGARIENDILYWHDRYNPSVPHETPMDRVFRVDCLAVATREAP